MSAAKKISKQRAQLKLVQQELQELPPPSDSFYELLFHEANDAILLVNKDTNLIESANRRMQELTGFLKQELLGAPVNILCPSAESTSTQKIRSKLFSEEMLSHSGFYEDIALKKKDGYLSFATLSVKSIPAAQTGGHNVAFCILHNMGEKKSMERDLLTKHWELKNAFTELERAHLELKSAQEALVQAGKLAALGELAAGVAHELNQPLSGVMGFSQELQLFVREKFPDPAALDYIQEIIKNSLRMKKIIQQLREFTRKSTEDFQDSDVLNIIHESLKLLHQQFKSRGIVVDIQCAPDIPKIYCNPFQLEQVFINLATNARDAIEAKGMGGGNINISVQWQNKSDHKFIEIYFKDDGIGMSAETKNRALEPFYTTKEVGKGTGLGLSVSYGILSKMQGSVVIESAPGKGTNFCITLPVDYRNLNSNNNFTTEKEGNHGTHTSR